MMLERAVPVIDCGCPIAQACLASAARVGEKRKGYV
jgi:hypothetical protein